MVQVVSRRPGMTLYSDPQLQEKHTLISTQLHTANPQRKLWYKW